ncbi:MAG: SagB/ThcOx family dehydrogenase [Gammaproteobacteria bacterium]|nr:SagB/ThcOx family dehydrogenase [Gammaproteobacteria bacterium]MBU1555376.1 SagB/ThcOx family dehydrogenase [Gammaproteobacteria bacterium]MBU2070540.1 SagB/ThcOx family dehydrogenase [Gammaproteobacteria bacterium]MBU2185352.1 SagB/ThcOx family dehydrogenase [Gammaproteobacteria bacterium]MBU2207046.1 SagB/ThcOx family dehydrogenase [Gammaproteobacteria bacterium]
MSLLARKNKTSFAEDHWTGSEAAVFHEQTKHTRVELIKRTPRIRTYLSDLKCIQETGRNYKEYDIYRQIPLSDIQLQKQSLSEALKTRRSSYNFNGEALSFTDLSDLLGAAAGVTIKRPLSRQLPDEVLASRSYPSGGGLYPCELYVVAVNVEGLAAGFYHYDNARHGLDPIADASGIAQLATQCLATQYFPNIACALIITSVFERTVTKYGDRGYRLALLEAGHLMQNLLLTATAQGLGNLCWGAYQDNEVASLLQTDVLAEPPVHMAFVGHCGAAV